VPSGVASDPVSDAALIIPMTILLDPSGAVWTDDASNVSRPAPSGAIQIDAEHPARNRKSPSKDSPCAAVENRRVSGSGSIPTSRSTGSPSTATGRADRLRHQRPRRHHRRTGPPGRPLAGEDRRPPPEPSTSPPNSYEEMRLASELGTCLPSVMLPASDHGAQRDDFPARLDRGELARSFRWSFRQGPHHITGPY
jgi:hypothetical protein